MPPTPIRFSASFRSSNSPKNCDFLASVLQSMKNDMCIASRREGQFQQNCAPRRGEKLIFNKIMIFAPRRSEMASFSRFVHLVEARWPISAELCTSSRREALSISLSVSGFENFGSGSRQIYAKRCCGGAPRSVFNL